MSTTLSSERRRRLAARLLPLLALAVLAFGSGLVVGARHEPRERVIAERFLTAWERDEIGSMYELVDASSRAEYTAESFRELYRAAAETSTLEQIRVTGPLEQSGSDFRVAVQAGTRLFGDVDGELAFSVVSEADDLSGIAFEPELAFPGLRPGETLERDVRMPPRAALKARDGTVLAEGVDRTSEVTIAPGVVGSVGPIPKEDAERYASMGYPADATVGISGLERQFEDRLVGTLGGTLSASDRTLATVVPQSAQAVKTSIDLDIEEAAVAALAGRLGGIAVLRPGTGEVLALAGYDCCAPQPPGSTFKIITVASALENGTVKPDAEFPVETQTVLSGVTLENANGEACGGSLEESFAHSCNSVFAPMGASVGAEQLVATAEAFGFNQPWDIVGQVPGAIPPASSIGDELAVGATAIGQGQVTSLPLGMAEVASVIANDGKLVRPVLAKGEQGVTSQAISARTAATITKFMRAVVEEGTGTAAAVEGVKVAGKTGTAELRTTVPDPATPDAFVENDPANTDAWFVAFAPAQKPKVVVAVLLVGAGQGGATAAPAAKLVLDAVF